MMDYEITFADGEVESGLCYSDCDDILHLVREAYRRGEEITLRMSQHDPTPQYSTIGEMF
jgi:hypothetical protein